jgi:hypothetical protein
VNHSLVVLVSVLTLFSAALSQTLSPSLLAYSQEATPLQRAAALMNAGDAAVAANQLGTAENAYRQAAEAFHSAGNAAQEAIAYEKLAAVYEQEAAGQATVVPVSKSSIPNGTPPTRTATSVKSGLPAAPKHSPVITPPTPAGKASLTIRVLGQVVSGQPFKVQVSGFAGDAGDWVTVASVGEADTTYHEYFYANSKREAEFTFARPLDPGSYEVRVFFDQPGQKNVVQARQRFTVTGTAKAKGPVPATLPKGTYQCFLYAPHLNGSGGFSMRYEVQADIVLGSASYPFTYDAGAGKMRFTGGPFKDIVADTFFHAGGPAIGFNRKDGVLENCWPR